MASTNLAVHSRPLILAFLTMAAFTLFIQTVHMVEHVAQVVQKFVLGITPAHGLIGQLDLEPVHFWFNLSYLAFLGLTFMGWLLCLRDVSRCTSYWSTFTGILLTGLLIQMWHMTEHSVNFAQFLNTGMQGTPGILGSYFEPVLLHFFYNLIVYLPLVIVFIGAKLYFLPRVGMKG